MTEVRLQKAKQEDLGRLRSLYWELLDSSKAYEKTLQWKKGIYPADGDWLHYIQREEMYLIFLGDETVGAVALAGEQPQFYRTIPWVRKLSEEEVTVIHLFAVSPKQQGRGIAKAALDSMVSRALNEGKKALRLDAISTNQAAQKLYEKFGFYKCGSANAYYESTGTAEFYFYEFPLQ